MIMTIVRITPVTSPPRNVPVKYKNCWYKYALTITLCYMPMMHIPTKVIGFCAIDVCVTAHHRMLLRALCQIGIHVMIKPTRTWNSYYPHVKELSKGNLWVLQITSCDH